MNKTRLFKKSLLAVTISTATIASQPALAAGFQLNSQSATGLGRAFAGDAVIADNASVMSRNAAAMSLFDRTEVSVGFNVIDSEVDVKNSTYTSPLGSQTVADTTNDATSVIPNLYLVHPVNEKFAVGLGLYSNFGTTNEFDSSWGANTGTVITSGGNVVQAVPGADAFGGVTNVTTMNFLIAGSYRINEQWSVGGGLDIIYGEGELKRTSKANIVDASAPTTVVGESDLDLMDIDASGVTVGFNLGTVFELDENNRFGLSYHYSPEKEVDGTVSYQGNSNIGDLKIPLPSMAEFSGYHRINNSPFAVHYSVQWISWSDFDRLVTTDGTEIKEYKWQDTFHYSIGGTYYINENWEARIGYMFDEGVQDELTSVSVPDSDRQWFSAGASYHFNKDQVVDLGFTYLVGEDVAVNDTIGSGATQLSLDTTTKATAMLFGVQYTHRF